MIEKSNTHPGNVFRHCPECGSSGIVYSRDNSILCGRCGFHFFFNAASAVAAIIRDRQGRVLLTKRAKHPKKGMLDLPGGFVDILESAEDALRREILEELNLEVDSSSYMTSFPNTYLYDGITYFTLDMAFACTVKDIDSISISDEISEVVFFYPDEIDTDYIGLDSIRMIVSQYIRSCVS